MTLLKTASQAAVNLLSSDAGPGQAVVKLAYFTFVIGCAITAVNLLSHKKSCEDMAFDLAQNQVAAAQAPSGGIDAGMAKIASVCAASSR